MAKISKSLKVGLIGCGKVAVNRHLPTLKSLKEAEVVAVADIDAECLNSVADKFQIEKRYIDYNALLQDPTVEAVVVCTPLQYHFEVALTALEAGKHLLLEKPLTITLDEADRLIDRAARTDRKVMVGFNKRWHRLVRQARDIIQKDMLGPVGLINTVFCTGHFNRYLPEWRRLRESGGGSLIENGSHSYDLWHFLLQSDVEEVSSVSESTDRCDDEPAIVTARTSNGVYLNSVLSEFLPDRSIIEIFGQDCILRVSLHKFDGLEFSPLHSCEGNLRNRLRNISRFFKELPRSILQARYGGDYNASYRAQWKHFIDCIQQDIPVECTIEDGRRALQVALAAVKSASTRQPVKVAQAPKNIIPVGSNIQVKNSHE